MIAFDNVTVAFDGAAALSGIDLAVAAGDLCVLVGPSGSGKSTLLRLVNRLVEPTAGVVRVRGTDVATLEPAALRRSIGYVIQSIGLFPHRTVAQNVAIVPRLLGWPADKVRERVEAMLALVRLGGAGIESRYPDELSGGQAQRIGLARALAGDPDILLMDEPFGAVDPIVRRELRAELRRIHAETGKTILLVTHDPTEALELATGLVVLRAGRVVAAGAPRTLLAPRGNAFVHELFGDGEIGLRRLRFVQVREVMDRRPESAVPRIAETASLREALARMVEERARILGVEAADGRLVGSIALDALVDRRSGERS